MGWDRNNHTLSRFLTKRLIAPTVDGQNPWETIVRWYLHGNHQNPGFLNGAAKWFSQPSIATNRLVAPRSQGHSRKLDPYIPDFFFPGLRVPPAGFRTRSTQEVKIRNQGHSRKLDPIVCLPLER